MIQHRHKDVEGEADANSTMRSAYHDPAPWR
jgi:hypothetical protein